MTDDLDRMNLSEIIQVAREQGYGNLGRHLTRKEVIQVIDRGSPGTEVDECRLEGKRIKIERHIDRNRRRLVSQLPGCDGKCTTFGCPNLVVVRCWEGFRHDML